MKFQINQNLDRFLVNRLRCNEMTGKICDTLMTKYEETFIYRTQKFIKDFIINIGIFKSFGFVISILISLQLINIVNLLNNAYYILKIITIGEYESSIISTCLFLIVISYYELYYIDNIIKWMFK